MVRLLALITCLAALSAATSSPCGSSAKSSGHASKSHSIKSHTSASHSTKTHISESHSTKSHASSRSSHHSKSVHRGSRASRISSIGSGSQPTCAASAVTTITSTSTPISTAYTTTYRASILGDDGYLTPGATRTYTTIVTSTTTITVDSTTTLTETPTTKVGEDQVYTMPPPSGFRPVQDTLPGAVYRFQQGGGDTNPNNAPVNKRSPSPPLKRRQALPACQTVTSLTTAPPSTTTSTISSDCILIFLAASTAVNCSDYTTYNTLVTSTEIDTSSAPQFTTTTTESTTSTVLPTTSTVYAACATSNFANYRNDGTDTAILSAARYYGRFATVTTAYDCCVLANYDNVVDLFSPVWYWDPNPANVSGFGPFCALSSSDGNYNFCSPGGGDDQADRQLTAQLASGNGTDSVVVGNGLCGELVGYTM